MNNQGFVLIGSLIYLPFVFMLLFSFYWLIWFLNQKHQVDKICYLGVLQSQLAIEQGNRSILELNPKAHGLILEKKKLNFLIKTSPPKVKLLALVKKKQVIAQQLLLKARQQQLFLQSQWRSRQALFELQKKMNDHFSDISRHWSGGQQPLLHFKTKWKKNQLKIKQRDTAPTYQRVLNASYRQTIGFQWHFPLESMSPKWLLALVPVQKSWHGECYSHPFEQGGIWRSSIGAGSL
jgi:hypothetical protein